MKLVRFAWFLTCRGTRFDLYWVIVGARCHLLGRWPPAHTWLDLVEKIFPLRVENWLKMAWNGFNLLDFELPEEQDLASLGRCQVPGATCLGGGHLPTPDWTLGAGKFPHQTPLDPFGWSKLTQHQRGKIFKNVSQNFWMSFTELKVVFWPQTSGYKVDLWISSKNSIFGDAIPVRLEPLKNPASGYKIHCRSENVGPEWPQESQLMQTCPGQAIQPISEQKNWKNQTFSFSEKRPFCTIFWIGSARIAKNHPKKLRKPLGWPSYTLKHLKLLISGPKS